MEIVSAAATGVVVSVLSKTLTNLCLKGFDKIKGLLSQNNSAPIMITEEEAEELKEKHGIIESATKTK